MDTNQSRPRPYILVLLHAVFYSLLLMALYGLVQPLAHLTDLTSPEDDVKFLN